MIQETEKGWHRVIFIFFFGLKDKSEKKCSAEVRVTSTLHFYFCGNQNAEEKIMHSATSHSIQTFTTYPTKKSHAIIHKEVYKKPGSKHPKHEYLQKLPRS